MLEQIPERSTELVSRVMDDGTVIISPVTGQLSVVNEAGSTIWQLVDGNHSVAAIVQEIIYHFDVSLDQAQEDVVAFLETLEQREMISWKQEGQHTTNDA